MNDSDLYTPLPTRRRLSDQVSRQIQELIRNGTVQPGQRLPPERELADQFNVSRTVIREAVRSLAAKGLVQVSAGSGATVSVPDTSVVSESIGLILQLRVRENLLQQLFEVRRLLEAEIARLAAERRNDNDLDLLEDLYRQMETCDDVETYAALDVAFHEALARATQNEIYPILLDSIVDIMLEIRRIALTDPVVMHNAQEHHGQILERISQGDGEGARRVMLDHLDDGEKQMRAILTEQKAAPSGAA
jgi:GntR family transcriptional repressor for pyruvate dehydrogenase complex